MKCTRCHRWPVPANETLCEMCFAESLSSGSPPVSPSEASAATGSMQMNPPSAAPKPEPVLSEAGELTKVKYDVAAAKRDHERGDSSYLIELAELAEYERRSAVTWHQIANAMGYETGGRWKELGDELPRNLHEHIGRQRERVRAMIAAAPKNLPAPPLPRPLHDGRDWLLDERHVNEVSDATGVNAAWVRIAVRAYFDAAFPSPPLKDGEPS